MRSLHARLPARRLPRLIAVPLGLLLAAALLAVPAAPAAGVEDVTPARVAGLERAETAAEIARQAFPDGTSTAILATAVAPFDALTATSLAGALDAAMLLAYPDRLPQVTDQALADLGVTDVILIGGEQSIGAEVEDGLSERFTTRRIAGTTQYDTAEEVSTATAAAVGLPLIDGLRTVLLANGEVFADALAGSPAGFAGPIPVLFTEVDDLRLETRRFLGEQDVEHVVILGGPAAVNEAVAEQILGTGRQVTRLGGVDRTDTATTVATWTTETLGFGTTDVMLARGDDFPDALTAGQLAGRHTRPLVLSATPAVLPAGVEAWLAARCATIQVVQAVGGEAAVSTGVLEQAEQAAEACDADGNPVQPGGDGALPDFAVDPLSVTFPLDDVDTVEVTGLDDAAVLDVALFPCTAVAVDEDGSARFADADADGTADGYGTSVTDAARIVGINFAGIDQTTVVDGAQAEAQDDGTGLRLGVQLSAFGDDCTVMAVVPDQPAPAIPVDAQGRSTVPYGVAVVEFGDGAAPGPDPNPQTYRVEPQEALQLQRGTEAVFTVSGRYDGQQITDLLDLVLFPCEGVDVLGGGVDTFSDADGDGFADGFGATDTGAAVITEVNGQPIDPATTVATVQPIEDAIEFVVEAGAADCTTVAVIAGDGNGGFDVDGSGQPLEDYGVGRVTFS